MGIGSRIKEQAQKSGITLRKLAEITGISYNTIYSITKRDSNRVQGEILQRIANALGVTPTYLIGYDDKIVTPDQYTPEELAELKAGAWETYQQHITEFSDPCVNLNTSFRYGEHLRTARNKSNLTQIEAAKKIGISVNSLRLYEADKRIPTVPVLFRMADLYGVTIDYLHRGKAFDSEDLPKTKLINAFLKLNQKGQAVALERVEELTEIPKYLRPALNSADLLETPDEK